MTSIQHILTVSTDFFTAMMQSLLTGQSSIADLTQATEIFVRKLGRDILTDVLEQTDEALYKTVKPTHAYHVKESRRPRTLTTTFGDITFYRRYYKYLPTGMYTYHTLNLTVTKKFDKNLNVFAGIDNIENKKILDLYLEGRFWKIGASYTF